MEDLDFFRKRSFEIFLRDLVVASWELRKEHFYNLSQEAPKNLRHGGFKDFCLLKIKGPRRCGHSTTMLHIGMELFKNPLYIFQNYASLEYSKSKHNKICPHCGQKYEFGMKTTLGCFEVDIRGKEFDAIFVDYTSYLEPRQIDKIEQIAFENFSRNPEKFILFYMG